MKLSLCAIFGWLTLAAVLLSIANRWLAIAVFAASIIPLVAYLLHRKDRFSHRPAVSTVITIVCLVPIYVSSAGPVEMFRRYLYHRGYDAPHARLVEFRDIVYRPIYPVESGGIVDISDSLSLRYALYLAEWDGYGYHLFCIQGSDESGKDDFR